MTGGHWFYFGAERYSSSTNTISDLETLTSEWVTPDSLE